MSEDQVAKLIEQVDSLRLGEELQEIGGPNGLQNEAEAVAIFSQWLVRKSSCPVNFKWKDLGEYFWPRWIRQGSCKSDSKTASKIRGCSWPQGMNCVQGDVKMLQILRWHCRSRQNRSKHDKRRKCQWYKVPYPVTSSCKCACQ
jgi:hypothetical protein